MTLTATSSGLAILGLMLTALLGMAVFDRSDPAGYSLSQVWALGVDVALWILLSILMLLYTRRGNVKWPAGLGLPSVYLLAAAAQSRRACTARHSTAGCELSASAASGSGGVPSVRDRQDVVEPSPLGGPAGCSAEHRLVDPHSAPAAGPAPLVAAGAPVAAGGRSASAGSRGRSLRRRKHRQAVGLADLAGLREVRGFSTATPLSRIIFYMSSESPGLRDAARERARSIANRQAEAEQMLSAGDDRLLRQLAYLDSGGRHPRFASHPGGYCRN